MNRIITVNSAIPTLEDGTVLIEQCLLFSTNDPLILSTLLTCISGLFIFLKMLPRALPEILNKIFATLTLNLPGQTKETRSRAVKNARKHAASMLCSLARAQPQILMEAFEFIDEVYGKLCEGDISQLERCTVSEALMLINNNFCDYKRQSAYLEKLLLHTNTQWLDMKEAFSSASTYMSFIGLNTPPVEPSDNDICGKNRSKILAFLNSTSAVLKRSVVPEDTNKAESGGFFVDGRANFRNPASPHVLPLFHQLFCFIKVNCELWQPECISLLSEGYQKAYHLPERDRINIMGFSMQKLDDPCIENHKVSN